MGQSEDECEICDSPSVLLLNKSCSDKCPAGQTVVTADNNSKECEKCQDPNATKCEKDTPDESTECKKDCILMPLTKKCQKPAICKDGLFYVEKTNKCKQCPTECKTCDDASNCTECKLGNEPVSGVCNANCPAKQTLVDGKCVKCKDPLCKNCDENLECVKCDKGTFLNPTDKKCHKVCPTGTYAKKNGECAPCGNGCQECSSFLMCTKCKKDSILLEKIGSAKCVDVCPKKQVGD